MLFRSVRVIVCCVIKRILIGVREMIVPPQNRAPTPLSEEFDVDEYTHNNFSVFIYQPAFSVANEMVDTSNQTSI